MWNIPYCAVLIWKPTSTTFIYSYLKSAVKQAGDFNTRSVSKPVDIHTFPVRLRTVLQLSNPPRTKSLYHERKTKMLMIFLIFGFAAALPANNMYDSANANDVDINSVHLDKKYDASTLKTVEFHAEAATSVPQSTVKFGVKLNDAIPTQGGGGFSRIIDDIFNIPITVLQSVARLLTNPFKQAIKSPDLPSTY